MKSTQLEWGRLPQFFFLLSIFFLFSCGDSLDDLENVPLSNPVQIPRYIGYGSAIDEDDQLWQWHIDKKGEIQDLQKVKIGDVHLVNLGRYIEHLAMAIDKKGVVWQWDRREPSKARAVIYDDITMPIVKLGRVGDRYADEQKVFLLADGTVRAEGEELEDNNSDFTGFKNIKDIAVVSGNVAGLDTAGNVFVIGTFGDLTNGKRGGTETVIQVEGLSNIKRLLGKTFPTSSSSMGFFAINEVNDIFYWGSIFNTSKIQKVSLNKDIRTLDYYNAISKDGNVYRVRVQGKANKKTGVMQYLIGEELSEEHRHLIHSKNYGTWGTYNKKVIVLEIDGTLAIYDIGGEKGKYLLSNPKRIGDFKVKMDYFKK